MASAWAVGRPPGISTSVDGRSGGEPVVSDREPAAGAPDAPSPRYRPEVLALAASSDVEVALLDPDGRIVSVNDAWSRFCDDNGGDAARCGVGVSYLDVCDRAGDDPMAVLVADSVRSALRGELPAPLAVDVPCHSSGALRWFDVLVSSRLGDDGACVGATVTLSLARVVPRTNGPARGVPPDPAPALSGWPGGDGSAELLGDGVAHAVFAVAPCAILVADDDDRIVAANAQADALFAAGAGGLVGHRLDRVLPLRWRDGGSASAADAAGRWHDPAYSGRATVGLGLDGTYFRLHLASAPVPLSYGTGVLVTASAVDEDADRVGDGSGELLVDLDAALRRIFAAGLTLTGVRERLDRDGVPARALAGVIADLDRAAGELRQAGRST